MKSIIFLFLLLPVSWQAYAQQTRAFNQNASRSNHTRRSFAAENNSFIFRLTGGINKPISDSIAHKAVFVPGIIAQYYTGNFGIGAEAGSFNSSAAFDVNAYTAGIRNFTVTSIENTQWKTWYILAGPSYRKGFGIMGDYGYPLQLSVDLHGGMLKMRPASFSVKDEENGVLIADYYSEQKRHTDIERQLFAIKPNLRAEWFPGGGKTGFNISASFLQAIGAKEISTYHRDLSKVRMEMPPAEVRYQVLNAPVIESRTKGPAGNYSINAGRSFRLGRNNRQRQYNNETVNYDGQNVAPPREPLNGLPTGKRSAAVLTEMNTQQGCGGVTQKLTAPDGTIQELHFSCAADAALYNRQMPTVNTVPGSAISQLTTARQTQGATFGEKIAISGDAGTSEPVLPSQQKRGFGIIAGRLSWVSQPSGNILTNIPGSATKQLSFGTLVRLHGREAGSGIATGKRSREAGSGMATGRRSREAGSGMATGRRSREAGSGMATGRRSREAGSGMATGRRQYQPLFTEGEPAINTSHFSVQTRTLYSSGSGDNPLFEGSAHMHENPLYDQPGNVGNNPMHEGAAKAIENPLYNGGGASGENPLFKGTSLLKNNSSGNENAGSGAIGGVAVYLADARTGIVISGTKTSSDGSFFFAYVPEAPYTIRVSDVIRNYKSYAINMTQPTEIAGGVAHSNDQVQLALSTVMKPDSNAVAQALSKGMFAGNNTMRHDGFYFLPRSNTREDILLEMRKGNDVSTLLTDAEGNFEYTAAKAGEYSLISQYDMLLDNEIAVGLQENALNVQAKNEGGNQQAFPIPVSYNTETSSKVLLAEADLNGDGSYETDVTQVLPSELLTDATGNIVPQQKAGISTSRSNIRTRNSIHTDEGICIDYTTLIVEGKEAAVKLYLKHRHDTVKNSIGNIR